MAGVLHIQARKSAACHALARHASPHSGWEVETDGDLSTITSEQMRQAEGQTEHSMGLTFREDGKDLNIQSVEIPEQMRGQGIGTQLYLQAFQHAKESGLGFKSDVGPTPEVIAVYARLVKAGAPITQQRVDVAGKEVVQFSIPAEALQETDIASLGQTTLEQANA
jgi:predicted GNAT family acetyltransferase